MIMSFTIRSPPSRVPGPEWRRQKRRASPGWDDLRVPGRAQTVYEHIMTAPRGTGWLSRLIVAQVRFVTGGSVHAVTEELTDEQRCAEAMRSPGSGDEL